MSSGGLRTDGHYAAINTSCHHSISGSPGSEAIRLLRRSLYMIINYDHRPSYCSIEKKKLDCLRLPFLCNVMSCMPTVLLCTEHSEKN